ncbi:polyprenyl synthetase family protein [Microbacterium betulae]|uniref:Polyprenyl synthetase family protein n=1 Tax=Microbacterium betulae TaxID=2981139 RepID=A0AA97FHB0_9MICO|nr:polyprenyl synthetase family protein [Microbacterium sp. AB]WOF22668.1 polyprenyl synthetase family protein [Microbacterium sp. AB]
MTMNETTAPGAVDDVIDAFFAERIARADRLAPSYAALWRRAAEASLGGKRLRPRLLLAAHDALGGGDRVSALTAAAAFELLHTALLLHDDVLDGDLVRRGRPNLAGGFAADALDDGLGGAAASAWGEASGLLAGDVLISAVHALVARLETPARRAVHEIVDDSLFVTAAGEHADVGFGLGAIPASAADIVRMMEQKTASYSFAAPLRAAAAIAEAGPDVDGALHRVGTQLGFLYQLRDDVLGVFGAEERTGKSVLGDLREGKRTLLIAFAEEQPAWRRVRHLFGRRSLEADDAARLRDALLACGAAEEIERLIDEHRGQACRDIEDASLPAPLRRELVALAHRIAERDG